MTNQQDSTRLDSTRLAAAWYQQFQGVIFHALSSRAIRPADIEDLAQEVYLRLLRVPKPELVENPQAYLYRVALNVAEEWRNRAAQRLPHSSDGLTEIPGRDDGDSLARAAEREALVQAALASLSQSNRTAVILHIRDGMSYEEVADHMGVSRRAVRRYVANGYASLRGKLNSLRLDENVISPKRESARDGVRKTK